jgi:hypothetical protein
MKGRCSMPKRAILAMVVSLVALVAVGATLVACTAQTVQHAATPTLAPSPTPLPTWPTAPTSRLKGTVTEFRIPTKYYSAT